MSIIKHVSLQKIVAHDFRYDPRKIVISVRYELRLKQQLTIDRPKQRPFCVLLLTEM